MAAPLCMSNDGNPAVFIGTFMSSGDSVALCNDCMPSWAGAVLAGMLGIDPDLFSAAVAAMEQDANGGNAMEPQETAAPPAMVEPPNTAGSAPPPAPADTDQDHDPADAVEQPQDPVPVVAVEGDDCT